VTRSARRENYIRAVSGEAFDGEFHVVNAMSTTDLRRIATGYWTSFWGGMQSLGTFFSGIIGIYLIFCLVGHAIGLFIRSYQLQQVFGWSFHVLGALLTSLTNFLLHQRVNVPANADVPMAPVPSTSALSPERQPLAKSDLYPELENLRKFP
jgi:hypothetical protein